MRERQSEYCGAPLDHALVEAPRLLSGEDKVSPLELRQLQVMLSLLLRSMKRVRQVHSRSVRHAVSVFLKGALEMVVEVEFFEVLSHRSLTATSLPAGCKSSVKGVDWRT